MKKIVILISGRGTNMQTIVRAAKAENWSAQIAAVISNREDAEGLTFAAQNGIECVVVPSKNYVSRESFDTVLQQKIDAFAPDLVVLAGFMRILTAPFVTAYKDRMINIHPSLLPSFTGLKTHEQALRAGVRVHGATVHFVTPELDHGPIIAQVTIPVCDEDTPETLAARLLIEEHKIYPLAVRWFVDDELIVQGNRVIRRYVSPT
ncbi:MAG: phosphoribosylglycinamide formyltransferase [Burkholderiaceae bacterium]|nr:phosphoribosylglycinamide formyltransferase [Burkholderiaceae bacterium]